jgi:hypothetical protein
MEEGFRVSSLRSVPTLASGLLAAVLACPRGARAAPSNALSEALIVLPGAANVQRDSRMGASAASYEMNVAFPASGPILEIVTRLAKLGWTPLKEDSFNPGIPTSMVRSWTSFVDASKAGRRRRYSWASEWRDTKGDRVHYAFRYEAPEESQRPLLRLAVSASAVPSELEDRVERYLGSNPARSFPTPLSEGPGRTVLDAAVGGAFLASGPAGEAVFRITGTSGEQVAYRWRFRAPDGSETRDAVPVSSTLRAGPFRLFWMSHSPVGSKRGGAGVGYSADEMDLIPVPGEQFETLDLGQVHALATLLPDRNRWYAEPVPRPERAYQDRLVSLMEAGNAVRLGPGRALLVRGPRGSGVIEIVEPELRSVKYRWRFRGAGSDWDSSGKSEASDSPFPNLRVGPYSLQWQMRSVSKRKDDQGTRITDWIADVKYLPEEFTVQTIPAEEAAKRDLGSAATPAKAP